jgi:hypothetical protein
MSTAFSTYSRYGAQSLYTESDDPKQVARELIDELRTEEFEEPDDEHTEVSISRDDWAISVVVFGRVTLQDLSWITGNETDNPKNAKHMVDDLHMRDVPDDKLVALMADLARGNIDRVRSANWLTNEQLPPYVRPFYRST